MVRGCLVGMLALAQVSVLAGCAGAGAQSAADDPPWLAERIARWGPDTPGLDDANAAGGIGADDDADQIDLRP